MDTIPIHVNRLLVAKGLRAFGDGYVSLLLLATFRKVRPPEEKKQAEQNPERRVPIGSQADCLVIAGIANRTEAAASLISERIVR